MGYVTYKTNSGHVVNTENEALFVNTVYAGFQEHDNGNSSEAVLTLTTAINAYRFTSDTWIHYISAFAKRGEAYNKLNSYQLAIDDFTTAIENKPLKTGQRGYDDTSKLDVRYLNRAVSYEGVGNYDKAINDLFRVVNLGSYYAAVFNNLGSVHKKKSNPNYNVYLEISDSYKNNRGDLTQTHYNAAQKLQAIGDNNFGIAVLDRINIAKEQTQDKREAEIRGNWFLTIGYLYQKLGDNSKAIQNIKYAANYNNKEARTYLKDHHIRHKKLLWEPNRNGFVSFLFGLACGAGVLLGVVWVILIKAGGHLHMRGLMGLLAILGVLAVGIVSAIVAGKAWSRKKNILFVFMLLLAAPGWLSFFGMVPNSLKHMYQAEAAVIANKNKFKNIEVKVNRDADLYTSTGSTGSVHHRISKGETVRFNSVSNNGWAYAAHNNFLGYIKLEYLDMPEDFYPWLEAQTEE